MKATRKITSIILTLALVLTMSVTAFADWNQYGGNANHNAYMTSGAPTAATGASTTPINLTSGVSGWTGVDNLPVMQTIGGKTYAYILYDGRGTNGGRVVKYNCTDRTTVWTTDPYGTVGGNSLNAKSGFQLSTPYLDDKGTDSATDDVLYLGVLSQYDDYVGGEWLTGTGSKLMRISNLDGNDTTDKPVVETLVSGITGQINTPIVKSGDYVYFGTWTSNSGAGAYYQVDVSSSTVSYQTFTTSGYGFYWAGAVVVDGYVFFGSDNGTLYWREAGEGFGTVGGSLNLKSTVEDAGNVRSTIVLDEASGALYFTSQGSSATGHQGGYLWCCSFGRGTLAVEWYVGLTGVSTSTPTIAGDRIYVGTYGTKGKGIRCIDKTSKSITATLLTDFAIQSSIVVMRSGNTDYLYFTVNAAESSNGGGYCYSVTNSTTPTTATNVWGCTCAYPLAGMAIDNGVAVFGNDSNALYIIK